MKNLKFLMAFALFVMTPLSYAFSAVADVSGHAGETIYAAWNYATQREADTAALEGCRSSARENGLSALARKCAVVQRQKGPGGGAIVCGHDGCTYTLGYGTQSAAIDAAYEHCAQRFKGCRKTNITTWWDDAGYRKRLVQDVSGGKTCSPPVGKAVRSQTQCKNGDCIRTFENGCQLRFQAPYCHDPATGRWEWKPEGC